MADITAEVTLAMWEAAEPEQRRQWRARAWVIDGKIGPNYPWQREPAYEDLMGPSTDQVIEAGRVQFGKTTVADAQALAKKARAANKREKAA